MRHVVLNRAVNHVMLTPKQDHRVLTTALQLHPSLRDAFILRVERKLHLRDSPVVTDKLVDDIISNVAQQLRVNHD